MHYFSRYFTEVKHYFMDISSANMSQLVLLCAVILSYIQLGKSDCDGE